MQRLSAVALLILLGWQISGWYILHPLNRQAVLQILKHNPPQHLLCEVIVSNTDLHLLQWVEKDKEFVLNGKWYDVVYAEICDSITSFYCFADEPDTQLFDYSYGSDNTQNLPQKQQTNRLKFAGVVYFVSVNRFFFSLPPVQTALANRLLTANVASVPASDVPTPPPQICASV